MDMLPLTPGLVASAMIRHNHAVFMPSFGDTTNDPIARALGTPEERIPEAMETILRMYEEAQQGMLRDVQILEEFTGTGFYSPEREEGYVRALDQFHGMLALVMDRIAVRAR